MSNVQVKLENLFNSLKTSSLDDVYFLYLEIGNLLFENSYYEEGADYLIKSLPYFKHQDKNALYLVTLKKIIDSLIFIKNEEALKYIYLYQDAIPATAEEKHLLNMIKFNKAFNKQYLHLIDDLKNINSQSDELVTLILERISNSNDLNKIKTDIEYLKTIASEEVLQTLYELNLKILYENNNYQELEKMLKEGILQKYYQILLNIKEDRFKVVQELETEHEKDFKKLSLENQEMLYNSLVTYYQDKDLKSKAYYEEKLKQLKKEVRKVSKEKKKTLVIPKEELKAEVLPLALTKEIKIKSDKIFFLFEELFNDLSKEVYLDDLHENLRNKLIVISKYFNFSDVLIYLNKQTFHYKKERLYQKHYDKDLVEQAILGISLKNREDIVFNVGESKYHYDLVSNNNFSETNIKQVYAYYLNNNNGIVFYQEEKKSLYEEDLKFKLLSSFLSYEIVQSNNFLKKSTEVKIKSNFFDNDFLTAFYLVNNNIFGTKSFNKIFNINRNTTLDGLLLTIEISERTKFKEALEMITNHNNNRQSITFKHNQETYLVELINNQIIYAIFYNITFKERELKEQKELATYNLLTNCQTLVKFKKDLESKINDKQTFLLISLKNSDTIENIYGKEEVIKELTNEINYFAKELVYEYDGSSFLVSLPFNDIRAVNNYLKDLPNKEKLAIGILRYPVESRERDFHKVISYLSLAHYHAKTSLTGHFFFKYETYLNDKYETEILKQIERLIETNQLKLEFTQIINLNSNKVYAYLVNLFDESLLIESSYYEHVAKLKNKLPLLEKYLLKETFKAFKEIHLKTNKYLRIVVVINEETIKDKLFNSFLIGLFKQYEVPYSLIDLIIKGNNYKNTYLKLEELTNLGVNIGTNNYDYLTFNSTKIFYHTNKLDLNNEKEMFFITGLKDYAAKTKTKLIFDNIESSETVDRLKGLEVGYLIGGKNYRKWKFSDLLDYIKAF